MTADSDSGLRTGDVLAFWRRISPMHGMTISEATLVSRLGEGWFNQLYLVTDGDFQAVVRWPRRDLDSARGIEYRASLSIFTAAADAGLAPRVLFVDDAAGELDGQPVMVSEYVGGEMAKDWFRGNVRQAAILLARLHRSETLTNLLEGYGRGDSHRDCLTAVREEWARLQQLAADLTAQDWPSAIRSALDEVIAALTWAGSQIHAHSAAFRAVKVGPIHADPNCYNWRIGSDNRAVLIDWDQARLDDPALDVGSVLHWYVPPALWPLFAREYAACGSDPVDADALLARARIRYPLHAIWLCLFCLEHLRANPAGEQDALDFMGAFLDDLRRIRAGTFGAG